MASSLPNWMVVALSGALVAGIIGYLNIFIPKDQKNKAKRISFDEIDSPDSCIITYKWRFDGIWYIILSLSFAIATTIVFNEYSDVVKRLNEGFFGNFARIVSSVAIFVLVGIALILIPIITESLAYRDYEKYYFKRYGVTLMSEYELEEYLNALSSKNPRD